MHAFWLTIAPPNVPSIRLAERLGYESIPDKAEWPMLTSYDPGDLVYRLHLR